MKGIKILNNKKWALSHGLIIGGLILLSVGLALGPSRYVGGSIGLIIAGI